jgi:hypothetical protein
MPGPKPERLSTIHTMPATGKKAINRRTVSVPRRTRKASNSSNPATRPARCHYTLIRRDRASFPNHPCTRSPWR